MVRAEIVEGNDWGTISVTVSGVPSDDSTVLSFPHCMNLSFSTILP